MAAPRLEPTPGPPPDLDADGIYTARFEALSQLVLSIPADGFDRRARAFAAAADALDDVAGRIRAESTELRESLQGTAGVSAVDHGTGLVTEVDAVAAAIAGDAALLRRAGDGVAGAQQSMRELVAERARAVADSADPGVAAQYDERARSVLKGLVRTYVQVGTGFTPFPGAKNTPGAPGADAVALRAEGTGLIPGGAEPIQDVALQESPGTVPALPAAALSLAPVSGVHAVAVDPATTGRPGGVTPMMPAGMTPVLGRTVDAVGAPASFTEGQAPAVLGAMPAGTGPMRGSAPGNSQLPVHVAAQHPAEPGAQAPRALGRAAGVPADASSPEDLSSEMLPSAFESPAAPPMAGTALAAAGAPPRALGREAKDASAQRSGGGMVVPETPAVDKTQSDGGRRPDGLRERVATASSMPAPVVPAPLSPPPADHAPGVPATAGSAAVEPAVAGRPSNPALPDPAVAVRRADLAPPSALQSLSPPQRPEPGPPAPAPAPAPAWAAPGTHPPMMPMGMGGMGMGGMGGPPSDENRTREVVLQEEPGAWDDGTAAAPAVLGRR